MTAERTLTLEPIGYISTPYASRFDAPHQPSEGVEGVITLLPERNFEQALEDLEGMEKLWVIYWFDRNENWKPKVLVPRGERKKRGLFATRSPHRPNPLGLSLVDLVEINGRTLRVRNVDLLDGTPILDLKPYLPYLEAQPNARAGWIEEAQRAHESPDYHLQWNELARQQAEFLEKRGVDLRSYLDRVLARDPQPHPYRRIEKRGDAYTIAVRAWRVHYVVEGSEVRILRIESGYTARELREESVEALSEGREQKEFFAAWPFED